MVEYIFPNIYIITVLMECIYRMTALFRMEVWVRKISKKFKKWISNITMLV